MPQSSPFVIAIVVIVLNAYGRSVKKNIVPSSAPPSPLQIYAKCQFYRPVRPPNPPRGRRGKIHLVTCVSIIGRDICTIPHEEVEEGGTISKAENEGRRMYISFLRKCVIATPIVFNSRWRA